MKVSIIIPIYKQEKTIKTDLENICDTMSKTRWKYEVIGVVDGSPDSSYKYDVNKGKGYAVRYGMARATGDYISFIDAGMDIDPNGISMLMEHMEWYNADIVVASKKHPVSQVNRYPTMRKVYSFGYFIMVKILFGLNIKDTQTGLKVYRRQVLEKVLPRLMVKQFAFDIEILAVARYLGFKRIFEAPVKVRLGFDNTTFSTMMIFDKYIQAMVVDTLAIFYRLKIRRYYSDDSKRKWVYDKDLEMRVNTGELG